MTNRKAKQKSTVLQIIHLWEETLQPCSQAWNLNLQDRPCSRVECCAMQSPYRCASRTWAWVCRRPASTGNCRGDFQRASEHPSPFAVLSQANKTWRRMAMDLTWNSNYAPFCCKCGPWKLNRKVTISSTSLEPISGDFSQLFLIPHLLVYVMWPMFLPHGKT